MYTDSKLSVRTMATAFAAATIYTGLLFAVSASPAQAGTPTDPFVRGVEAQIAAQPKLAPSGDGVATIAVDIDAVGKVSKMALVESTGDGVLDQDALRVARDLRWPAGRARHVAVVLTYGSAKAPAKVISQAIVGRYTNAKGEALASEMPAPHVG